MVRPRGSNPGSSRNKQCKIRTSHRVIILLDVEYFTGQVSRSAELGRHVRHEAVVEYRPVVVRHRRGWPEVLAPRIWNERHFGENLIFEQWNRFGEFSPLWQFCDGLFIFGKILNLLLCIFGQFFIL